MWLGVTNLQNSSSIHNKIGDLGDYVLVTNLQNSSSIHNLTEVLEVMVLVTNLQNSSSISLERTYQILMHSKTGMKKLQWSFFYNPYEVKTNKTLNF